jgi:hypothetical protein
MSVTVETLPSEILALIRRYAMDRNDYGLREALAAGLQYPGTPLPRRYIESVQLRVDGVWVSL